MMTLARTAIRPRILWLGPLHPGVREDRMHSEGAYGLGGVWYFALVRLVVAHSGAHIPNYLPDRKSVV